MKNKFLYFYLFSLSLTMVFLPGCVYLSHLDEVMFMRSLEESQKDMQAEINREEKLYKRLKTDIDNGNLNKQTKKQIIYARYGEPTLCRPADGRDEIRETCMYRKPAGGELILLNLSAQDKLISWEIQAR
ncbi:MAG: hypothetical protein WC442_04675 [Candidatus Omnitrophota bacterium]